MRRVRFLCFRFLAPIAVVSMVLLPTTNSPKPLAAPQEDTAPVPVFPTGALASFPEAAAQPALRKIFIRRDAAEDSRVWVVNSQEVLLPVSTEANASNQAMKTESGVGFIVPQLPSGAYVAWYEAGASNPGAQSMKLSILPQLQADTGIIRGKPGDNVQVTVRISSPTVTQKDRETPDEVKVPVLLQSNNSDIANLPKEQVPEISTNHEGYAVWTVHISKPGIAEFTATAKDFQPTSVMVVGMSRPAPTFYEGEMIAAREALAEQQRAAVVAAARAEELKRAESDRPAAKSTGTTRPGVPRRVQEIARAQQKVEEMQVRVMGAQKVIGELSAQQRVFQPPSVSEKELVPGDVLLVRGGSFPSAQIAGAETRAGGQEALYSHASLYLGKRDGVGMVAEMWKTGYWITPIKVSTQGVIIVDVYRRDGIDDAKRREIAARAEGLYGTRNQFISLLVPLNGSLIPYAVEQIVVLGSANKVSAFILRGFASGADLLAGGRKKMICSELVAWIYYDVGLALQVQHWKSLMDANVLTSDARRMDYTTPNMLARSNSIRLVGRYLGP